MMQVMANRKGIELIVDIDVHLSEITADILKFKEIIYNLVENAIKFTPSKGTVIITAIQDRANVKISVADTGIGISKENMDRIFDPFFQVIVYNAQIWRHRIGTSPYKKFIVMHGAIYGLRANR
jgi:signal transduction histidine kinase